MSSTLFIRADASVAIGTGHIMRMIALGQAWQEQGEEVHFMCAEITPALAHRLASEGFHLSRMQAALGSGEDLLQTLEWIAKTLKAERENPRVVLDGYHFGADYQLGIKEAGFKLLVVDDYGHADFYHADWVLNQNISARESLYAQRSPETRLLLGPKFAMLRKEFLAYKGWQRKIAPVARKILVTLGGSDPDNVTLKVIQALVDLDLHAKIVVGGSNPHLAEIEKFIQSKKSTGSVMEIIVNATNMPELMVWADIAVSAGGSTAWELAFMGLPSFMLILAENQRAIGDKLKTQGVGLVFDIKNKNLSEIVAANIVDLKSNNSIRVEMSVKSQALVDGFGGSRISQLIYAD